MSSTTTTVPFNDETGPCMTDDIESPGVMLGLVFGVMISIPLWALIAGGIRLLFQ